MDGTWLFRLDNRPERRRSCESGDRAAGSTVTVPNAWNVGDDCDAVDARRRRLVPQGLQAARARPSALSWVVRFESVNYRSRVWLNGKPIGTNTRRLPPVRDPPAERPAQARRRRTGSSSASTRAAGRPTSRPSGLSTDGVPTGGWWNYGGILREVYLRKIDDVDFNTVVVRPDLAVRDLRRDASTYRVTLRNVTARGRGASRVTRAASARRKRRPRHARRSAPSGFATFDAQRSRSPSRACGRRPSPYLYDVIAAPSARAAHGLQRYTLQTGIRSIKVVDGHLFLNGAADELPRRRRCTRTRKHEGFAIDNKRRDQQLAWVKELGATVHPHALPAAPVHAGARRRARDAASGRRSRSTRSRRGTSSRSSCASSPPRELESNIDDQRQPPVGDHLVDRQRAQRAARPGAGRLHQGARSSARQGARPDAPGRHRRRRLPVGRLPARVRAARRHRHQRLLRLVPRARAARSPTARCSRTTSTRCAPCYPNKAHRGHRVRRGGQPRRPGGGEGHLRLPAGLRQLPPRRLRDQAVAVAARSTGRCRSSACGPDWDGGNPRPQPPIHQKGLVTFDGVRKPAFFDVQRIFRATKQFRAVPRSGL